MGVASYLVGAVIIVLLAISVLFILSSLTHAPMFSFLARLVASFFALILCSGFGVVASPLLRIAGYGGLSQWAAGRTFKYAMLALTGVEFQITDKEDGLSVRPGVFVGNHQTELDVLMLGTIFPKYCSVTAKSSLKWTPVLGWFMALSKTVFINRSSRTASLAAFASAAETMHSHQQSVWIFPEGTRSYSRKPTMLPFKKGAFHLAVQAQVPIIPVVIANYNNVLDVERRVFNSGKIPVSVLRPIETKGLTKEDVDGLVVKIQDVMEKELVRLSEYAVVQGIAMPAKTA